MTDTQNTNDLIKKFGIKAVIGKGGMGERTSKACQKFGCASRRLQRFGPKHDKFDMRLAIFFCNCIANFACVVPHEACAHLPAQLNHALRSLHCSL